MKQLVLITLLILSYNVKAQENDFKPREKHHERMKNISAEDIAELKTKKMTLHLDLSDEQQVKIKKLMLQKAKEKKSQMAKHQKMKEKNKKPTQQQRINYQKNRLNKQIEIKKQLKTILNTNQYIKLEKMLEKRRSKKTERRKRHK